MDTITADPLAPAQEEIAGFRLDALVKGVPPGATLRLDQAGAQGWNLLRGDLPFPAAVLRADLLRRNSRWMAEFTKSNNLSLAPHGKTTMAPQLWSLQLADGAWAITVATIHQLQIARRFGVKRVILANQPVGRLAVDACFAALRDPDFELFVLVDSAAVVAGLAEGAGRAGLDRPLNVLLEIGIPGGRTGARTLEAALTVARAAAQAPGLALRGVEAFEGILSGTAEVDPFLDRIVEAARACRAEKLFASGEVLLTAGGSAFFDRIGPHFARAGIGPVRQVLRSGCYITHDSLGYEESYRRIRAENAMPLPGWDLEPALELWAMVQSRPEPGKMILTFGKRDAGTDLGLPVPRFWFRPGAMTEPAPMPAFHIVRGLNDQHAHVTCPADSPLQVGDLVGLGIGHPCTTFDRWQVLWLADEARNIVGAVRTFF